MIPEQRTLVEAQYSVGAAANRPQLVHKRLFAFTVWPPSATQQLEVLRKVVRAFESVDIDKINIAGVNTIGPVFIAK